jgi:hypothetical protein
MTVMASSAHRTWLRWPRVRGFALKSSDSRSIASAGHAAGPVLTRFEMAVVVSKGQRSGSLRVELDQHQPRGGLMAR